MFSSFTLFAIAVAAKELYIVPPGLGSDINKDSEVFIPSFSQRADLGESKTNALNDFIADQSAMAGIEGMMPPTGEPVENHFAQTTKRVDESISLDGKLKVSKPKKNVKKGKKAVIVTSVTSSDSDSLANFSSTGESEQPEIVVAKTKNAKKMPKKNGKKSSGGLNFNNLFNMLTPGDRKKDKKKTKMNGVAKHSGLLDDMDSDNFDPLASLFGLSPKKEKKNNKGVKRNSKDDLDFYSATKKKAKTTPSSIFRRPETPITKDTRWMVLFSKDITDEQFDLAQWWITDNGGRLGRIFNDLGPDMRAYYAYMDSSISMHTRSLFHILESMKKDPEIGQLVDIIVRDDETHDHAGMYEL